MSSCTFLRYPPRKLGKHVSRLLGKYFPGIAWRELSGVKSRTRGRARWLSRFSRLLSIKLHYSGMAQRGSSGEEKHWGKIIELWTRTVLCLRLEFGNQVRCLRRLKEDGHSPHSILPSLFLSLPLPHQSLTLPLAQLNKNLQTTESRDYQGSYYLRI